MFRRWSWSALGVSVLLLAIALPDLALAAVPWAKRLKGCEPPNVFYSSRHVAGRAPCCTTQPGVCPGGVVCPSSGVCPQSGIRCVVQPPVDRPNIVLFIADDQGVCHYGSAGECRSAQTGTPVPAPATPNLDLIASRGTVFPIAHNTAAWCYPSLNSILTGRYQKSLGKRRSRLGQNYVTVASTLRSLGGVASIPDDPFDRSAKIGGYCAYLGGKFTASAGDPGFDAGGRSGTARLGRLECVPGDGDEPPRCGSDRGTGYAPFTVTAMRDFFEFVDSLKYKVPGAAAAYRLQPFFAWYAPRIPHQPLRAPRPIGEYLFGRDPGGMGGLFDLGALCAVNGVCPAEVGAFNESNFGTVREYFANVYLADANLREMRKFFAKLGEPHCIGADGQSRFDIQNPQNCGGTWAPITPDPGHNTAIIYLSDNGWHLPNSKHNFTENGYRTRMIVFDPRGMAQAPSWEASEEPALPPRESAAIAHSTDILPTVLGLALGTPGAQECPASIDGSRCDGRDLRPVLFTNPGGPAAPETLRHSLCGHQTQRGTKPSRSRYFVTRPGSVGRCVRSQAPSCLATAQCGAGNACIGGKCVSAATNSCSSNAQCAPGAACLGGRCMAAPPCVDDANCSDIFGAGYTCGAKSDNWCRNAPDQACDAHADCPACPNGGACGRVCEPRILKLYLNPGGTSTELVDLFLDPDEHARTERRSTDPLFAQMSSLNGPYGPSIRKMACCVEDWWPEGAAGGSLCSGVCPADMVCNK